MPETKAATAAANRAYESIRFAGFEREYGRLTGHRTNDKESVWTQVEGRAGLALGKENAVALSEVSQAVENLAVALAFAPELTAGDFKRLTRPFVGLDTTELL